MAIKISGFNTIDDNRVVQLDSLGFSNGSMMNLPANVAGSLKTTLNNPSPYDGSAGGDQYGASVAVDGDYMIVGANVEDDAGGFFSGKAYIYNVTTGALVHTLNNPNRYGTSASDYFGNSVAISGNYAIVVANQEDDAGGTDSGKAYIFNVTTGQLVWTLNNPNAYGTSAGDQFGYSVAISGNYAIVGASNEADAGGTYSGKAYIFNVTTGALVWTLNNPNAYSISVGDTFGNSVAISGNYAIVGALTEDDAGGPVAGQGTDSGKAYIFNVTTGQLLWTLNNPNAYSTSANDQFGYSVAISGDYAIVSAYLEDDAGGLDSGKAYIFNVTTGQLVWTLNNPTAYSISSGDQFGYSVAISGNYAIVGARLEDDAGGTSSGKAYIYNVTTGQLVWTLNNPNAYSTSAGDLFGVSVAISGNYAIVSAISEDDASGLTAGSASGKVYQFKVSDGQLLKTYDNPNVYGSSSGDWFGSTVAISGNYAIVGAYRENSDSATWSGKAYIFNVTTGALVWVLNNPNAYGTSTNDYFGSTTIGISGNYAIIGANGEDDGATGGDSGKAYIFNVTTGQLVWTLNNPNTYSTSASDWFGRDCAISGNYAIVGAYTEDDAGGSTSGKAYIFNVTTGNLVWTLNNPTAYGTSASDAFGQFVAISGNYAIVGAYSEDDGATGGGSGKAYIFNVTTGQLVWTLNNPNAYGTSAGDNFGYSVAISGNYAIVGAYGEDDSATSLSSGKAYIFNVTTGALVWTLNNPNAYSTSAGDNFGFYLSISGNYAIIGAQLEDDASGADSGKAYIFNVTTGQLVWTLNNPNAYSTSANDQFGLAIAIDGNYAIVGAYLEDDAGGADSGKAYIFNVANTYEYTNITSLNGLEKLATPPVKHQSALPVAPYVAWTLNNPNAYGTSAQDAFGYSVAISGNYAIAGAYSEDDAGGALSGKAYIFNATTGALLWTLNDPNAYSTSAGDEFGSALAIDGNYAIIGALQESDASGFQSGKAYIFNVTTGTLLWTLNNPNAYSTSTSEFFASSVAISGNYAIVGAASEADAGGLSSGKAYIFNVTTGNLVRTLNNPNAYSTSFGDQFGQSVAISGNYAIVSAWQEDDAGGAGSGKVYIFNVTTGNLVWTLNNPNAYSTSAGDLFGVSVAISGNYAIVGAYGEDDAGGVDSGKAYIFNVTTGALVWTLNDPNAYGTSASDQFGSSVAISGNYAIVGANQETDSGGGQSGKVYIFNVTTGSLLSILNNPNAFSTSALDNFAKSVSISGNYAIVGAYLEADASGVQSGKAYIFNISPTNINNLEDRLLRLIPNNR